MKKSLGDLLKRSCRFTAKLHLFVALCGTLLLVGGTLAEFFGINSDALRALGIILFYLFGMGLLGAVLYSAIATVACTDDIPLVIQSVILLAMVLGMIFIDTDKPELFFTPPFAAYVAAVAFSFWRRYHRQRPAGRNDGAET